MNINDVKYGGSLHEYFWTSKNPNATIENGLANCTTFVYGSCLKDSLVPVSRIVNASSWHNYLINSWLKQDYDKSKIKVGDIIEWVKHVHVARVSKIIDGQIFVEASWYTGEHGKAMWNGSYDSRHFSSLKEMSDFFVNNYPTRFFHEWTLEDEIKGVGGEPEYLLSEPFLPDHQDQSKDQIQVFTDEQNVRNDEGKIVGSARSGFYDVHGTKEDGGYIWYSIEKNRWIALVNGRVAYIPKEEDTEIEKLRKENRELKERLRQINDLSEVSI